MVQTNVNENTVDDNASTAESCRRCSKLICGCENTEQSSYHQKRFEFAAKIIGSKDSNETKHTAAKDGALMSRQMVEKMLVIAFGMAIPALIMLVALFVAPKRFTLVALNHPLESIVELLLLLAIPCINGIAWHALSSGKSYALRWLMTGLGIAAGSSLIVSVISILAPLLAVSELTKTIGSDFTQGFLVLSVFFASAGATSLYLINRLRLSWELPSTRANLTAQAVVGVLLSLLAFIGAEIRPWCIRIAQQMAVSPVSAERNNGMSWLHVLNPEKELRMECTDARAAGLSGLFIPLKAKDQLQLYFALTGIPFNFRDMNATNLSSLPDYYLARRIIGDTVPRFILTRSALGGNIHPNSLTATLNWTFVIKNASNNDQEARAEIALPPGAVVTDFSVWEHSDKYDAGIISARNSLLCSYNNSIYINHSNSSGNCPGTVSDLGKGRVLLKWSPIPKDQEVRAMVTIVAPVAPGKRGAATLVMPKMLSANFSYEGEHRIRILSPQHLSTETKDLSVNRTSQGGYVLSGNLPTNLEESNIHILVERLNAPDVIVAEDPIALKLKKADEKARVLKKAKQIAEEQAQQNRVANKEFIQAMLDASPGFITAAQLNQIEKLLEKQQESKILPSITPKAIPEQYVVEKLQDITIAAPKHLVVVVDSSASVQKHKDEIIRALTHIPASIPTSIIIAGDDNKKIEALSLKSALAELSNLQESGGKDNLKAAVYGAELAGECEGGALLWIHGPQPVTNEEIYIMQPYAAKPAFYEMQIEANTDSSEFFKNHAEIGPFTQVSSWGDKVETSLDDFLARWMPNSKQTIAEIDNMEGPAEMGYMASPEESKELLVLHAAKECERLMSADKYRQATRDAVAYHFVSPVSAAILGINNQAGSVDNNGAEMEGIDGDDAKEATLSSGTVTSDGTAICGINTAANVRVNNLANLESLLNIIANSAELVGLLAGLFLIIQACFIRPDAIKITESFALERRVRIAAGVCLIVGGLIIPGAINWLVASARDCNLFS